MDQEKETIDLVHTKHTDIQDLPARIPKDTARYHFFLYKHSHEGDYLESIGKVLSYDHFPMNAGGVIGRLKVKSSDFLLIKFYGQLIRLAIVLLGGFNHWDTDRFRKSGILPCIRL